MFWKIFKQIRDMVGFVLCPLGCHVEGGPDGVLRVKLWPKGSTEVLIHRHVNVTISGTRILVNDRLKLTGCPYKKGKFGRGQALGEETAM